ncbi:MAG: prephenate dehydrogenase/arogenate dehydrogenase family protein [Candidatus Bathyarchaeota archaeon]|nr:prephenate dehydrogenase/arogenate dehydrogenase family protein [Candidatus Bathyarchaeota archaeon]
MLVAIIGGAGKMGSWFARYFLNRGQDVVIFDVNSDKAYLIAESLGVKVCKSSSEAARISDLLFVATPIEVTPKVISEVASELKKGSIIAEISSLKSKVFPVLREVSKLGLKTLSIHPLFGSGAQDMAGEKIALIPVSNPRLEESLAREIFPEASIIPVDCYLHDKIMALTLSLTHFINIAFASIIGEEDICMLRQLGGTTFTLQLTLSEAVMTEDPSLYASIQMNNEHTVEYIDKFMHNILKLKNIIESRDLEGFIQFYREVWKALSRDRDFEAAYKRMYRALKAI